MKRVGVVVVLLAGILLAAGPAMQAQPVGKVRVDYVPTGVPQRMNLQGYLTDTLGTSITDTLPMVFKIWRGGSAVWTENQSNCAVLSGLFCVGLGSVTPIPFSVFEPGTPCSLEVTVNSQTLPKVEITSVGFAYRSVKSDTATYAQSSAGGPPSGPAGGDLSNTYPNPLVDGLQGRSVPNIQPDSNEVLAWSGSTWVPANVGSLHNHLGQTWGSAACTLAIDTTLLGSRSGVGVMMKTPSAADERGLTIRMDKPSGNGDVTGVVADAYSNGNCLRMGGFFRVDHGTGVRRAVYARSYDASANSSSCYGGQFDVNGDGTGRKYGIYSDVSGTSGSEVWAGYFKGNVHITGTLSKGAGSFLIDHPLDPLNRTLRHNFVESPENLCLYRGKVRLGTDGSAVVNMPSYFVALTKETEATAIVTPVGRPFATGYEWNDAYDRLTLYGDAGREASYMVLADRDDPAMRQLRRPVEEAKGNGNFDKGRLLYPEAYGYPKQLGLDYCRQLEDASPSARSEGR